MGCSSSSPVASGDAAAPESSSAPPAASAGAAAGAGAAAPSPPALPPAPRPMLSQASRMSLQDIEARMQAALAAHVAQRRARTAAASAAAGGAGAGAHAASAMASFNRIILKFPQLHRAFKDVDRIFRRFDTDKSDTIDVGELALCLLALGAPREALLPQNTARGPSRHGSARGSSLTLISSASSLSMASERGAGAEEGAGAAPPGEGAAVDWSSPGLVRELFRFAHREADGKALLVSLTFKEFLLCLAVATVIDLFPKNTLTSFAAKVGTAGADGGGAKKSSAHSDKLAAALAAAAAVAAAEEAGGSKAAGGPSAVAAPAAPAGASSADADADEDADMFDSEKQLVAAMHLVLDAYVLFDKDGNGSIDRDEVLAMIEEETMRESDERQGGPPGKKKGGAAARGERRPTSNALLSRQRWEELDWDDDGSITFKE